MNPPKMPVHIGDYKRDTGHLRAAGHGAYLLLLFHHWSTGELPNDDDQLAAIACMTRGEWKRARPIIEKFFQPGWVHGRVLDDLAEAKESYGKLSKAGKLGAETRAKNKRCLSDAISDDGSIDSGDASSSVNLPLTFNQSKKKEDAADAALPELELFRRGKEVLGKNSGGLVKNLLRSKQNNIALARAALEQASTKADPREYIAAIIRGHEENSGNRPGYGDEWG